MPYLDIATNVASHTGLDLISDGPYLRQLINRAAKDLYTQDDLVGSLREQLVSYDSTYKQITTGAEVGETRGIRHFTWMTPLTLHDMRPRYATQGQVEQYKLSPMTWRLKGKMPIKVNVTNEGPVTLTLAAAETVQVVTVSLVGSNGFSSRVQEQVVFAVGETSKLSVNNYSADGWKSITKDAPNTYDLTITDMDGVVLTTISNGDKQSLYSIFQVANYPVDLSADTPQYVEILYKQTYTPFVNDYDEYPAIGYDDCIFWKTLTYYYANKKGEEMSIVLAEKKVQILMRQIAVDSERGVVHKMDFGNNKVVDIFDRFKYGGRRRKSTTGWFR